jgi:hypothetical protein
MRVFAWTLVAAAVSCGPGLAVADPAGKTLEAWTAYIEATEARRVQERTSPKGFLARDFGADRTQARKAALEGAVVVASWRTAAPDGAPWDVPNGQIHHWVGTVFVPGISLPVLLDRLHGTEVHQRQPDVLASRVLARDHDSLDLYLRLRRSQFVTVIYDTQHRVSFTRVDAAKAESTSIATRIVEVAETAGEWPAARPDDRGFLGRLNTYWRYEAVPGGVLVECESLSLSRSVPFGLGPIAGPFITRVARDSMTRTLETMREVLGQRTERFSSIRGGL